MSTHNCDQYREATLEKRGCGRAVDGDGEPQTCAECAAWLQRVERQIGVLVSLDRHVAPSELAARVEGELRNIEHRLEWAAARMTRHQAPAELDQLVAERIAGGAETTREEERNETHPLGTLLGELESLQAPHVLDRLVAEEIEKGPAAGVVRAVSELERFSAPSRLSARSSEALAAGASDQERQRSRFGVNGAMRSRLALFAAASLVAISALATDWFGLASNDAGVPYRWDGPVQTGFEARLAASGQRVKSPRLRAIRVTDPAVLSLSEQAILVSFQGPLDVAAESTPGLSPNEPLPPARELPGDERRQPATQLENQNARLEGEQG